MKPFYLFICVPVLAGLLFVLRHTFTLSADAHGSQPVAAAAADTLVIGQAPPFFTQRWGKPVSSSPDHSVWEKENLRVTVYFENGAAHTFRYDLLDGEWSSRQIAACLRTLGSNWKQVGNAGTWRSSDDDVATLTDRSMQVTSGSAIREAARRAEKIAPF